MVAGLDFGTVSAYALLDLEGNLVAFNSRRDFSHDALIRTMTNFGRIAFVCTDVTPIPASVSRVSRRLAAQVIEPSQPLARKEKERLLDAFFRKHSGLRRLNRHEKDALAAVLHGFRRLHPLLKRIDDTLESTSLPPHLLPIVKERVLKERIAIAKIVNRQCDKTVLA